MSLFPRRRIAKLADLPITRPQGPDRERCGLTAHDTAAFDAIVTATRAETARELVNERAAALQHRTKRLRIAACLTAAAAIALLILILG